MKKMIILLLSLILIFQLLFAEKIQVYFTDITKRTNIDVEQKIIDFINTANDTIIMCIYDIDSEKIADALNNKKDSCSIKIVYDNEHSDTSTIFDKLNVFGNNLKYSTGRTMHHKFIVIDDKFVLTGSTNFTVNGFTKNNNNIIIVEDTLLAENYNMQFENLFSGIFNEVLPVANNKYYIDSKYEIENHYSPSENVGTAIKEFIDEAKYNLYFCINSFNDNDIAQKFIDKYSAGVTVKGIGDGQKTGEILSDTTPYHLMKNAGIEFYLRSGLGELHHKFIIRDLGTDSAAILTGSANWSATAFNDNNENIVIIKNTPAIADKFYSEYLNLKKYSLTNLQKPSNISKAYFKPNPAQTTTRLFFELPENINSVNIKFFTVSGEKILELNPENIYAGSSNEIEIELKNQYGKTLASGIYLAVIKGISNTASNVKKIVKLAVLK